jgi:hypothetical protein
MDCPEGSGHLKLDLGVGGGAEDVGSRGEADRGGTGRQEVAVAFGAGAGEAVQLHVVVDGQADHGRLSDGQRHHQAGVGSGRPPARHRPASPYHYGRVGRRFRSSSASRASMMSAMSIPSRCQAPGRG